MFDGITIIGLGHLEQDQQPPQTQHLLETAPTLYLKAISSAQLGLDRSDARLIKPVFDSEDGLTDRYQSLAGQLIATAPVVFATPGDPLIDEAGTGIIQQTAAQAGVPVKLISGRPILTDMLTQLNITPTAGLQILDATLLCSYHYPPLEPHCPVLITGLYHPSLIKPVQRILGYLYPAQVTLTGLGDQGSIETTLDHLPPDVTAIFISAQTGNFGLTHFQEIIAHLRAPNGCPWDRKQTHQTLRPYLLDETYEVLAALDDDNPPELADELGDLLLQIALHAQIAAEAKTFHMNDVVTNICQKMIRRHPHVFGQVVVNDSDEVEVNWDAIKAREKAAKGQTNSTPSVMDNVTATLPALAQTLDISKKAVKLGFEWDDAAGVLAKLLEEAQELTQANDAAEIEAELGDFLFTAVNLARKLNVDAESALRACNIRFMRRFRRVEALARKQNLHLPEIDQSTWLKL